MPASQDKSPQKNPTPAQGNGPASKYRDERIQALAQLLADKANATSVGYALAALHLESLHQALILKTELDELTCAQLEATDLRREKELGRVRRAVRLEGEWMRLLNRASTSVLACLGGRQRLLFEAVHKANNPYEAEPADVYHEIAVQIARVMVERSVAFKLPLPKVAQEAVREMDPETVAQAERDGILDPKPAEREGIVEPKPDKDKKGEGESA